MAPSGRRPRIPPAVGEHLTSEPLPPACAMLDPSRDPHHGGGLTMSGARKSLGRAALCISIAAVLAARGGVPAAHAAKAAIAPATEPAPATAGAPTIAGAKDPQIADLDGQIKSLREQYHAQLDPLETQVKALKDKFDPQIASLEDQRRTLVEATKPQQVRDLDDQ